MAEPQYVLPNDYKRMELALGVKGAEAWRARNNLIVGVPPEEPAMDETEADYEGDEGYDDEELPPEKPTARSQLAVAGTGGLGGTDSMYGAYQQAQANVAKQMETNLALLNAAQQRLRERRIGPSESEKWLAIAAALGKPTRTGAFGESLSNLTETLGDQRAAARKAQEERESLLEQYGLKIGGEQLRMLQTGATQAGQAYRAAVAANKPRGLTWSEGMGQFVSPDNPVATKNKVTFEGIKQPLTQYTDGTLRLKNPDGSVSVYSPEGKKIKDIPAGGAQ